MLQTHYSPGNINRSKPCSILVIYGHREKESQHAICPLTGLPWSPGFPGFPLGPVTPGEPGLPCNKWARPRKGRRWWKKNPISNKLANMASFKSLLRNCMQQGRVKPNFKIAWRKKNLNNSQSYGADSSQTYFRTIWRKSVNTQFHSSQTLVLIDWLLNEFAESNPCFSVYLCCKTRKPIKREEWKLWLGKKSRK